MAGGSKQGSHQRPDREVLTAGASRSSQWQRNNKDVARFVCLAFIRVKQQNAFVLLSQPLDVIIVMLSKSVFMLNDCTLLSVGLMKDRG